MTDTSDNWLDDEPTFEGYSPDDYTESDYDYLPGDESSENGAGQQ